MSIASTGLGHNGGPPLSERPSYLDQGQASEYLKEKGLTISPTTLGKLRVVGGGPKYRKFGRKPVYVTPDLDTWIEEKLGTRRRSTSEAA